MTEKYPHDPDLPFLVITKNGTKLGRFAERANAENLAQWNEREVIDTTPKPRIPVDAEFITWGNLSTLATRETPNFWKYNGMRFTETELLAGQIQRSRIIVLDPRKEP